jgi:drug/metabolite transporter (DMT)-like permease
MSIFLSAVIFNHSFSSQGWFGVSVVAGVLLLRVYWKSKESKK